MWSLKNVDLVFQIITLHEFLKRHYSWGDFREVVTKIAIRNCDASMQQFMETLATYRQVIDVYHE